ncbi:MAG: nitrate reductase [Pseudomonadota bacterium]
MTGFANPLARKSRAGYREAIDRIKTETRILLDLAGDATVSVTELNCREPGCPDTETIVAIFRAGQPPAMARLHKPIPEIDMTELAEAVAALRQDR